MNNTMNNNNVSLGDRMKLYEKITDYKIPSSEYMIVRIDGHCFSKFTKKMNKPFDDNFSYAMIETTKKLLQEFNAITGYTQSDEITLIFTPINVNQINYHTFNGRIQKIVSLIASYTSICFNNILKEITKNENMTFAYFDARVFSVKTQQEVYNAILFRKRDGLKNSKSLFSSTYINSKELLYKSSDQQIAYCLEKTGKDWNIILDKYKYGVFIKKRRVEKTNNDNNIFIRHELIELSTPNFTIDMLINKYVN